MGFLDSLKDFGIGNRGPYGRMKSGATYLTDTIQDRLYVETDRGLNKAIATAAKGGKISPEMQIQISDRWGVPLNEVMKRSKPMNDKREAEDLKNMAVTFQERVMNYKKMNPDIDLRDKPELIKKLARTSGADTNEKVSFLVGGFQKLQSQSTLTQFDPTEPVTQVDKNITGGLTMTEKRPGTPEAETPKTAWAAFLSSGKRTTKEIIEFNKKMKETSAGVSTEQSDKVRKEMGSSIRAAAGKLITLKAGVDIVKEIMAAPAHTEALKELKKQILVMVKEYEELYGPGSARRIGFDTTLVRTGMKNGKKVVEYSDGTIEYAD